MSRASTKYFVKSFNSDIMSRVPTLILCQGLPLYYYVKGFHSNNFIVSRNFTQISWPVRPLMTKLSSRRSVHWNGYFHKVGQKFDSLRSGGGRVRGCHNQVPWLCGVLRLARQGAAGEGWPAGHWHSSYRFLILLVSTAQIIQGWLNVSTKVDFAANTREALDNFAGHELFLQTLNFSVDSDATSLNLLIPVMGLNKK